MVCLSFVQKEWREGNPQKQDGKGEAGCLTTGKAGHRGAHVLQHANQCRALCIPA